MPVVPGLVVTSQCWHHLLSVCCCRIHQKPLGFLLQSRQLPRGVHLSPAICRTVPAIGKWGLDMLFEVEFCVQDSPHPYHHTNKGEESDCIEVQVCREFSWLILHWSAFPDGLVYHVIGLIYEKTFSHVILYTSDCTSIHTCNQHSTQLSHRSLHARARTHTHIWLNFVSLICFRKFDPFPMAMRVFFSICFWQILVNFDTLCVTKFLGFVHSLVFKTDYNINELVLFVSLNGRVGGHMLRWICYSSCKSLHPTTYVTPPTFSNEDIKRSSFWNIFL